MHAVTKEEILEVLKTTMDPELGIDLHTLGLIYQVDLNEPAQELLITMTFTTPFCPYGPRIIGELQSRFRALGIREPKIKVVFDPPWAASKEVREMLGV